MHQHTRLAHPVDMIALYLDVVNRLWLLPLGPALHNGRPRKRLERLADFQVDGGNPRIAVHGPERMRGGHTDRFAFAGELQIVRLT